MEDILHIYERSKSMKEKFPKTELLGATRQILTEIAAWTDTLFSAGAAEHLIGMNPGRDPEWEDPGVSSWIERTEAVRTRDWNEAGCAGQIIEHSRVLNLVSKVIDYLNTNTWQGDAEDLWKSFIELFPLHCLLEGNWQTRQGDLVITMCYGSGDSAIDREAAEKLFRAIKVFSARANFEYCREEITISELASISGLAEKTVRMAAIGQDKNPDLTIFKSGRMTLVTIEEAHRWMASKNIGYRPTVYTSKTSLPPVEPTSVSELGVYLRRIRESSEIDYESLTTLTQWQESMMQTYRKLESGVVDEDLNQFSTKDLVLLAQTILPERSKELVRIIDKVIHPIQLDFQIEGGMKLDK